MRDERYDHVRRQCQGRLLDVGCGNNQLVKEYGNDSAGVDVFDFGGDAVIVEDTSHLPFEDGVFDTVTFIASINHIPNRSDVIREAGRLLSDNGRIVATMLSPFVGTVRHKLAWWDEDQGERGLREGEVYGLSHRSIVDIFAREGFRLVVRKRIVCWLNNLYVFEKAKD